MNINSAQAWWFGFFFIAIAVLAVWFPVLNNEFVWDDNLYLVNQPFFRVPGFAYEIVSQPFYISNNYYRPLPLLILLGVGRVANTDPLLYHGLVFALHLSNTLLVYVLASKLASSGRGSLVFALMGALIFGVSPSVTEVVSWVSGIFDALFALCAISLLYAQTLKIRAWWHLLLSALIFVFAAFTKESAISFVLVLPAWHAFLWSISNSSAREWLRQQRSLLLAAYGGCFVGGLLYVAVRYFMLGYLLQPAGSITETFEGIFRLGLVVKTLGFYALHIVIPYLDISPVYPSKAGVLFGGGWDLVYFSVGVLISLASALAIMRKKINLLIVFALFLGAVFPVLHILPLSIGDNFAHLRFIYFAWMLLCIVFSVLSARNLVGAGYWVARRYLVCGVAVLAISILVTRSVMPFWGDNMVLWGWAREVKPASATANNNFFASLASSGRCDLVLRDGVPLYQQGAMEAEPFGHFFAETLASCYARLNDVERAEHYYQEVFASAQIYDVPSVREWFSGAYVNLAALYLRNSWSYDQIPALLNFAVNLSPNNRRAFFFLGIYKRLNKLPGGDEDLGRAYALMAPNEQAGFKVVENDFLNKAALIP